MPAISKIRFTHVIYEGGSKRYNDETFTFDGHNGAVVLENGGGKTVFIQAAIQAVYPHAELAGRKVKETFTLEQGPAHIAIEWILTDKPRRRYLVTCISLFQSVQGLDSYRYIYEYGENDHNSLDHLPFTHKHFGKERVADKGEIQDYYADMVQREPLRAQSFTTISSYRNYIEEHYQIIAGEWEAMIKINSSEGGIEHFFDECKTTTQLFDRLLIPEVERSIEGYKPDLFARMFETHKEGFETYKKLKEQISENRNILQKLNDYVQLHEKLDQQQTTYNNMRSQAKAYYNLSLEQINVQTKEKEQLDEQMSVINELRSEYVKNRASLEIAFKQQDLGSIETQLNEVEKDVDAVNEQVSNLKNRYFSIQYAEERDNRDRTLAKIEQLNHQLTQLDASHDEKLLEKDWQLNGSWLKYVYDQQRSELAASEASWKDKVDKTENKQKFYTEEKREKEIEKNKLTNEITRIETAETMLKKEMEGISRSILTNPQSQDIPTQMRIWMEEEQKLEQLKLHTHQEIKMLDQQRVEMGIQLKAANMELDAKSKSLSRITSQEEQLNTAYNNLNLRLSTLRKEWEAFGSIYEKQSSIKERLETEIHRLKQEKDQRLAAERIAYRYVDDHGDQELFFADSIIQRLCVQWQSQFDLLQLGTHYINNLVSTEKKDLTGSADHLWAITLITTEYEKEALMAKLTATKENHIFPIRVLSITEATNLVRTYSDVNATFDMINNSNTWVTPIHWVDNESEDLFKLWKSKLQVEALQTKQAREDIDIEISRWDSVNQLFNDFIEQFPLTYQHELKTRRLHEESAVTSLQRDIESLKNKLEQNRVEEITKHQSISEVEARIIRLGQILQSGNQYMIKAREVSTLNQEIEIKRVQLDNINNMIQRLDKEYTVISSDLSHYKEELRQLRDLIRTLEQKPYYQEVQQYEQRETIDTILVLEEARHRLYLQRQRISGDRTQLEEKISLNQNNVNNYISKMSQLLRENPHLSKDTLLPIDAAEVQIELWKELCETEEQHKKLLNEEKIIKEKLLSIQSVLEQKIEDFKTRHGDMPKVFYESLSKVEERLNEEESSLQSKETQINTQYRIVDKQLDELNSVKEKWNQYLVVHRIANLELSPTTLQIEEQMEFNYQRTMYVNRCIEQLNSEAEKLSEVQHLVNKGRQHINQFLRSQVKDVKLQQMTLQGIEAKNNYEELLQFQEAMNQRIQMAIHFSEETMQKHDEELQQFIHHIHAHVKLVVQELREIPKKTRVRTEEGWKEIYVFHIPTWDEKNGVERIRQHIDWIMDQLDRIARSNELNGTDHQLNETRRNLDKWLNCKQLIQIVLQGEAMKVSCRKVGNDQVLSKAVYSWEQSNRWSGGEKWSKNMTLFLGLLNYVAERKQYIQAKMKRHRTVILDNPFGKASSDHVLHPVFFIAEQLGFQIIALTAHVEGKFLQDYFPVVYSCRLRSAANSANQIIETSQKISSAYFHDSDPGSLERLGIAIVQGELF